MNISDLKHGDVFYDASCFDTKKYIYVRIHPTNPNYHILVDGINIAHSIYKTTLQQILDKGLVQYSDAHKQMILLLEDRLEFVKKSQK